MGNPEKEVIVKEKQEVTEAQREILLEYAQWYDAPGNPPEDLVEEFLDQR